MPETTEDQTGEQPEGQEPPGQPPKPQTPKTIEEMLADSPEDVRTAVLDQLKKARNEAAKYRQQYRTAEPELAAARKLLAENQTAEQQAEAAAKAAEARVAAVTQRAVRSEVRALAADGFADPDDAAAFLDLASYIDDEGDIDTQQIRADLADLLTRKPHLGKPEVRRQPRPDPSQGSGASGKAKANPAEEFAAAVRGALQRSPT